jgi:hypothetical protein
MRKATLAWAAALLLAAGLLPWTDPGGTALLFGAAPAMADDSTANPCAPPTQISPIISQTAWQLWVAATCPVNPGKYPYVVWENWIEQAQMYPSQPDKGLVVPNAAAAGGNEHQLHGSGLTMAKHPSLGVTIPGLLGAANTNCNKASTPPKGQPNLIICEEIRLNGATEDYIAGNTFWRRGGQSLAAAYAEDIEFPAPSVEIKSDWIELSSIGLNCNKLPAGFTNTIHVETIDGNCFGLAGMHLISKLLDQWIWATFEPQNPITNPNRCVVLGCTDAFGSKPITTRGANTQLTNQLAALMYSANLAPEWFNYRLDGVQVGFYNPELLGNSIIEGENAGVPLTQSSCITCHDVSSIKADSTDGITLLTSNPVGSPAPLPSLAWIRRDFVWSLSTACVNSPFQSCSDP